MTNSEKKIYTVVSTFDSDFYIIENKTPDQIQELVDAGGTFVRMPNGARIHKSSISKMQSKEDYLFQAEQKSRHKKGQYIKNGQWRDNTGFELGISAELERITGSLNENLLPSKKPLALGGK